MRLSFTLIFLAILITFSSSYFLLSQIESKSRIRTDVHQVDDFKKYFVDNYSPVQKIDLGQIYAKTDAKSLVDPAYKLYHTHVYDYKTMQHFLHFKDYCRDASPLLEHMDKSAAGKKLDADLEAHFQDGDFEFPKEQMAAKVFIKLMMWAFVMDCKLPNASINIKENGSPTNETDTILPMRENLTRANFGNSAVFEKLEPFMHPFGNSFALMTLTAFPKEMDPKEKTKWAEEHLDYFHAKELSLLNSFAVTLPPEFSVLADLSQDALQALVNQETVIIAKNYVLFRNDSESGSSNPQFYPYLAYKMSSFEKALLGKYPYLKVSESEHNQNCLVEESNICWHQDTDKMDAFLKRYTIVFFATAMLVVFIMIYTVFKRISEEKREEEKKKFALQTLTHELRTPLTSMTIALENLRPAFDKLDTNEQTAFGRILSDSARLMRLAEASRQYLTSEKSKHFLNLKPAAISSCNAFIESALDLFAEKIKIHFLPTDMALTIDTYWLAICIKNLVDNALEHGANPVVVRLASTAHELRIAIQDQGQTAFANLDQMKSAFVKNNASQGLGLGLSLVDRILKDMGGRLEFSNSPTTFTLILPLRGDLL